MAAIGAGTREHDVEVRDWQQLGSALGQPLARAASPGTWGSAGCGR